MNRPQDVRRTIRRAIGLAILIAATQAHHSRADESGIVYRVEITGVEDKRLHDLLHQVSDAAALVKRLPASIAHLERRMERDIGRFRDVLHGKGYYAATVRGHIDEATAPVTLRYQIEPGPPYVLEAVHIEPETTPPQLSMPTAADLGLTTGKTAEAKPIRDAQHRLTRLCKEQGFPFAKVADRRVVVDHAEKNVRVTFKLEPGPSADFGPTNFDGLRQVSSAFVRSKLPWIEGDPYNAALLDKLQSALTRTGLFSMVRVTPGDALEQGRIPVHVTVTECKHRTVSAGIGYKTDEGPGAQASWEHRNLLHHGETLRLAATMSEIEKSFETTFRKPAFRRDDQSLLLNLRAGYDNPDAFESRSVAAEFTLERAMNEKLTLGRSILLRNARIDQFDKVRHFSLLAFRGRLDLDRSNNRYDPHRGYRISAQGAPYLDLGEADFAFFKTTLAYTHYVPLVPEGKLVLAARSRIGAMLGAGKLNTPADERYYAGGGDSIRGYPYQSIGPLRYGDPLGGRSLAELSAELRYRINQRFGVVTFVDGGTAFDSELPDLGDTMRWGAGVGARVYTPVGPFRFDIAVPVNPPRHVDDSFQFYLSLGHAF